MRTLCVFLISILTLQSCEDRRAFEVSNHTPEVVLNSIISTDSIWSVSLNYTKAITDKGDFQKIENASVKVLNLTSGQSFFLDEKQKGSYCRELNPVEGHEYELEVLIEGNDIVRASTYVPSVLDVEVLSKAQVDSEGQPTLEIDIAISDNPYEENFYVWDLRPYSTVQEEKDLPLINPSSEIPSVFTKDKIGFNEDVTSEDLLSDRPEFNQDVIYKFTREPQFGIDDELKTRSFNSSTYLSDKNTVKGKIYNRLLLGSDILADIEIRDDIIISSGGAEVVVDKKPIFQLNVRAVSSELYEYLQTYETYRQNNAKNTSILAPSEIYSNIENGDGIFGGYNLKTFNIY